MVSLSPPSGFRDFIDDEARRRAKLVQMISEVYESFGFLPLETPTLENLEILEGSGGQENEKLIFKVLKRGEKLQEALQKADVKSDAAAAGIAEYGLRFDMTVPLSRVVGAYRGKIKLPWKVFHIGPVWRAERPQKGRFREFFQCDVDIIGAKSTAAEIEVIQAVAAAVTRAGMKSFELKLNDRRIMQAVGEKFGFSGPKFAEFTVIVDKKDKLERDEILKQLEELAGGKLSSDLIDIVDGHWTLEKAAGLQSAAANDLQNIVSVIGSLGLPISKIEFDPSLARGMGYYTGPVFELKHPSVGYSLGGGGRYDRLIGKLSGQEIPACGFSIGFERLVMLLAETEAQASADSKTLFIPVFDETIRPKVLRLAKELRENGFIVDVYADQAKIKNQFKFASDKAYRWVLIAGEDEWAQNCFKLKDFISGEEQPVKKSDLVTRLRSLWQAQADQKDK